LRGSEKSTPFKIQRLAPPEWERTFLKSKTPEESGLGLGFMREKYAWSRRKNFPFVHFALETRSPYLIEILTSLQETPAGITLARSLVA
jgi:hypothetical protein